jgi:hypothetical protein
MDKPYDITNATYSMKLSYCINDNLWNSFEHSLSVAIKDDSNIDKINEELWEKVIKEVEDKIDESQKLYKG